jgi:hypothetical protein
MATTPGYSGTPLARKLGFKPGAHAHLIGAPAELMDWLAPLPDGVQFDARVATATDLVHLFTAEQRVLRQQLVLLRGRLRPDAMLWVSWPKKAARLPTDITEDVIRTVALPLGLVDVKVCAVSAVWSGLKLVIRKELR